MVMKYTTGRDIAFSFRLFWSSSVLVVVVAIVAAWRLKVGAMSPDLAEVFPKYLFEYVKFFYISGGQAGFLAQGDGFDFLYRVMRHETVGPLFNGAREMIFIWSPLYAIAANVVGWILTYAVKGFLRQRKGT